VDAAVETDEAGGRDAIDDDDDDAVRGGGLTATGREATARAAGGILERIFGVWEEEDA
jgi:hypothetical protein